MKVKTFTLQQIIICDKRYSLPPRERNTVTVYIMYLFFHSINKVMFVMNRYKFILSKLKTLANIFLEKCKT